MCKQIRTVDGLYIASTRRDLLRLLENQILPARARHVYEDIAGKDEDAQHADACLCGCRLDLLEDAVGMIFKADSFNWVWHGWKAK